MKIAFDTFTFYLVVGVERSLFSIIFKPIKRLHSVGWFGVLERPYMFVSVLAPPGFNFW